MYRNKNWLFCAFFLDMISLNRIGGWAPLSPLATPLLIKCIITAVAIIVVIMRAQN